MIVNVLEPILTIFIRTEFLEIIHVDQRQLQYHCATLENRFYSIQFSSCIFSIPNINISLFSSIFDLKDPTPI